MVGPERRQPSGPIAWWHQTCWPPVMCSSAPLTQIDCSVERKQIAFATSSECSRRCNGICSSTIFSVPGERIEASISPGEMAFTHAARRPKSGAISRVSSASAALEVDQAAPAKACPRLPAMELTFDDRALSRLELFEQAPHQHDRGGEAHLANVQRIRQGSLANTEARAARHVGEIAALFMSALRREPRPASRCFIVSLA